MADSLSRGHDSDAGHSQDAVVLTIGISRVRSFRVGAAQFR